MSSDSSCQSNAASTPVLALRTPQAAKALGISPRLLAKLVAERRVPHVRINSVLVFPVPELQRWLSEQARPCSDSMSRRDGKGRNGGGA